MTWEGAKIKSRVIQHRHDSLNVIWLAEGNAVVCSANAGESLLEFSYHPASDDPRNPKLQLIMVVVGPMTYICPALPDLGGSFFHPRSPDGKR